ncbi:MAG TPA: hypothetical protein VFP39_00575 [Gemmatimonadales bacterium]|nr:hypothetical protein [Gemmatimonadales bacterium]
MRAITACLLLLAGPATLSAQGAAPLCYHARPRADCGGFLLTNFGGYLLVGKDDWGDAPFREVADWGAMVNVGEKDAVGGSIFASLDRAGLLLGPELRYRRWLSASAALDVAVGTPLVSSSGNVQGGSITGLVRWSPSPGFAVLARPEALRWTSAVSCSPSGCATASRYHPRMSLGVEVGGIPGAVFTGLSVVGTYLLFLAVVNSD